MTVNEIHEENKLIERNFPYLKTHGDFTAHGVKHFENRIKLKSKIMIVKIVDEPMSDWGVEIGDTFKAKRYPLDPRCKVTLLEKISGSKSIYEKESLNHYIAALEFIN